MRDTTKPWAARLSPAPQGEFAQAPSREPPRFQPFAPPDCLNQCMHDSGPGVKSPAGASPTHPAGVDAEDVPLAVGGDARAFERIYRRHVGRVFGLASRLMGRDEAGEVTQDVFVRAWQ